MTEMQKQAAALEQEAYENLFLPAFVKLAREKGLPCETTDQLENLLKIAELIEEHEARQSTDTVKQAAADLEKLVRGQGTAPVNANMTAMAKQAAANPGWQNLVQRASQLQSQAA